MVFHVAGFNRVLMEESYGITPENSAAATIMALIMGKVIVVVNKLHFVNQFSSRPMVLPILWKTAIFGILGSTFQILEEGVPPLAYRPHSVSAGDGRLRDEMVWPKFLANHIVLLVWLLICCIAVELICEFGARDMIRGPSWQVGRSTHGSR